MYARILILLAILPAIGVALAIATSVFRERALLGWFTVALLVASISTTGGLLAEELDPARPVLVLTGNQGKIRELALKPGHQIDARDAVWRGEKYPVALEETGPMAVTWLGGSFDAGLDRQKLQGSAGWKRLHSSGGLIFQRFRTGLRISGARFENIGDAIRLKGCPNFVVEGIYARNIGDDFLENDWQESGQIRDCLVDGCHTGISVRADSRESARGLVVVEDCLIRLQSSRAVYRGQVYAGHGNFWKEDSTRSRVRFIIRNCVFAADARPYTQGRSLNPTGTIESSGNTFVWLGTGPIPFRVQRGWTQTTDQSVWEEAAKKWKREHGI